MTSKWLKGVVCLTLFCGVATARATATVYLELPPVQPIVGEVFEVRVMADLPSAIVGWGLDLTVAEGSVAEVTGVDVGDAWLPASTTDGDGLGGVAFPTAVWGDAVLLATFTMQALNEGTTELILGDDNPADLTEGIALDPTGFESVDYVPTILTVIPEPTSLGTLSGLILIGLVRRGSNRNALPANA